MEIVKKNLHFIEPFESLEDIQHIIVHHSSRRNMTTEECHEFHQKKRGWSGIGYNYFIEKDGTIVEGRGLHVGAHAYGYNRISIGICMTGDFDVETPTNAQLTSFLTLCGHFLRQYNLQPQDVLGHRELDGVTKSCPGLLINMEDLRKQVSEYLISFM